MAALEIVLLTHKHDAFDERSFLVKGLFEHWTAAGHRVRVHAGPSGVPQADVVFMHLDGTVVPREYVEAVANRKIVINRRALDISKRSFSPNLVSERDAYRGPVIVKTNRNAGGYPEAMHVARALAAGEPSRPARFLRTRYPVYDSIKAVPASAWRDPDLVVERFLPEQDERGYAIRYWVFLGNKERCSRYVEAHPIVKGDRALDRTPVPVPDELRAARAQLGFDYGKFDFVIHEGRPVLFDINRTPTIPANLTDAVRQQQGELALGLQAFV